MFWMFDAIRWVFTLLVIIQFQNVFVVADAPTSLCGQYDGWNSTNPAHPYLFIPNAWGDDGTGGSCLNVSDGGGSWTLKYKWTGTPTLVKQYAHMKVWPSNLPTRMKSVSHLQLKGKWSTLVDGTQNQSPADQALALHLNGVWSNVAVDMFLSTTAENVTGANPPIEIMIWPWYSPWVRPLGWNEADPNNPHVVMIDNTNFTMFHGYNDGGQHVFSWLAQKNLTSTNADYGPLIKYIWQKGLLSGDLWLAQLEFGTEVLHAAETTIFSASDYEVKLIRQGDPGDYTSTSTTSTMSATSTSSTRSATVATTTPSATPSSAADSNVHKGQFGLYETAGWLFAVMMTFTCMF